MGSHHAEGALARRPTAADQQWSSVDRRNLVFQGLGTGEIEAYRADTGQRLWSYQTNTGIATAPITVKVDGRQLLIVSGGNGASLMTLRGWRPFWNAPVRDATPHLMAFELGAHGEPPALTPVPPLPKPLVAATADPVNKGAALYSDLCEGCHGVNLEALRGSVPDLRRSPIPTNAAAFEAVVIGGARLTAGMPIFTELTEADAQEIRRYIIDRSWAAYNAQQGSH